MIVPTMTEQELVKEVILDFENAFRFSDACDRKFRRLVIKSSRFPVYACWEYLSRRKNRWLIFFEARRKKEVGEKCRITFVCLHNTNKGYHAIMVTFTEGVRHLVLFTPHFFSRYAERCGIELSGIELIKRYFRHNSSYVYTLKETRSGENAFVREVFGSAEEGVALGVASTEGNILFRTFITYGMTKGEQIEKFAENERLRKEIHNTL